MSNELQLASSDQKLRDRSRGVVYRLDNLTPRERVLKVFYFLDIP